MNKLILLTAAFPFLEGCGKKKRSLIGLPGLTADMNTREMLQRLGDTTVLRGNIAKKDNAIREKEERKKGHLSLPLQEGCEVGSLNHIIHYT